MKIIRSLAVAAALGLASLGMAGKAEAACTPIGTNAYFGCSVSEFFGALDLASLTPGAFLSFTGYVSVTSSEIVSWALSGTLTTLDFYYFVGTTTTTALTAGIPTSSSSVETVFSLGASGVTPIPVPLPIAGAGLPFLVLGAAYLLRRRQAAAAV